MRTTTIAAMALTVILSATSFGAQCGPSMMVVRPPPCTKAEAEQAKLTLKDPKLLRELYDETIAGIVDPDPTKTPVIDEIVINNRLSCVNYYNFIAGGHEGNQELLRRAAYVNFHNPIYDPWERQPAVVANILSRIDPDDEYFKKFLNQAAMHYQQSIDAYTNREGWNTFSMAQLSKQPPESAKIVKTCLSKIEDKEWVKHYLKIAAATLDRYTIIIAEEKREILHPELSGAIDFINNNARDVFGLQEGQQLQNEFYTFMR